MEDDFKELAEIWKDGYCKDTDCDAADAAIDAIREIVVQHGNMLSRPFNVLENWTYSTKMTLHLNYSWTSWFMANSAVFSESSTKPSTTPMTCVLTIALPPSSPRRPIQRTRD